LYCSLMVALFRRVTGFSPRRVCPDAPGDLCVLSEPPATVLGELDAGLVAATVLAGELVFDRG